MSNMGGIQSWLKGSDLVGVIVPSTDEFLSEFAPPHNRRLLWATGFRGSTGTAIILREAAALFLDGRYRRQGARDVSDMAVSIEPASANARQIWLQNHSNPGDRLGIDARLHSMLDMAQWRRAAKAAGLELIAAITPIDALWRDDRPPPRHWSFVDYPLLFAGEEHAAKCSRIVRHVQESGLRALLVANPEDVSWLLNVRLSSSDLQTEVGQWHVVPSCPSRVLVENDATITWFIDELSQIDDAVLCRIGSNIRVATLDDLPDVLRRLSVEGSIAAEPRRTPAALAMTVEESGVLVADDLITRLRWRKHPVEVDAARKAHVTDAVAVTRFMAWVVDAVGAQDVTEFQAAEKLESLRRESSDYIGPSMPLMSASGPNSSLPHYVPQRDSDRSLNDHPLYWMDSGGQYLGGTTDNTIAIAMGTPEYRHIRAHTLVLKAYLSLAMAKVPMGASALHLDIIARHVLWREGINYGHGTGHGVGNFLNIHEGPSLYCEAMPATLAVIEPGMIIANEPGYYVDGDYGVRIESHMVATPSDIEGFLEFDTISRLPIDPRLVDFDLLSREERAWLAAYHRKILHDLQDKLDGQSATWLRGLVEAFERRAE